MNIDYKLMNHVNRHFGIQENLVAVGKRLEKIGLVENLIKKKKSIRDLEDGSDVDVDASISVATFTSNVSRDESINKGHTVA